MRPKLLIWLVHTALIAREERYWIHISQASSFCCCIKPTLSLLLFYFLQHPVCVVCTGGMGNPPSCAPVPEFTGAFGSRFAAASAHINGVGNRKEYRKQHATNRFPRTIPSHCGPILPKLPGEWCCFPWHTVDRPVNQIANMKEKIVLCG